MLCQLSRNLLIAALVLSIGLPAQDAAVARGQMVYMQVCFACHQSTGLAGESKVGRRMS